MEGRLLYDIVKKAKSYESLRSNLHKDNRFISFDSKLFTWIKKQGVKCNILLLRDCLQKFGVLSF